MTNTVGTVGSLQNAPQQTPAATAVSAPATSSVDSKPLVGGSNTPISPRLVVDPLAGVITEFLSDTGQVQSQIPSAAVVAYLRAGLTASGLTKQTPETQHENATNGNTVLA